MFIQGNLQVVFDALYAMGVINPALKMSWSPLDQAMKKQPHRLQEMIQVVNHCERDEKVLIEKLQKFDSEALLFLAMEVARELVEFEDRKTIH